MTPLPSSVPVTLLDNEQISHSKSPIISASTNIKKVSGYLFCDHNSWLLESREMGEDRGRERDRQIEEGERQTWGFSSLVSLVVA